MSDDANNNAIFTPGLLSDAAPAGAAEHQAVSSLRGYSYQVAVSALAWLDLPPDGRLFLEVAEDYATVASQALNAVQVKDTVGSGSVTLNTQSVRDAVDAFVDLLTRNPGRDVQLRYLTTSQLGTEQSIADRPSGEAGLLNWRKAAAGASVKPLRLILTSEKFSTRVRDFVAKRDDDALRRDLLRKIHWDCGQPDLFAVDHELKERLIVFGRKQFHVPAAEAERLADILMHRILKKSILKNPEDRALTRADLYATVDAATRLSMPRAAIDAMAHLASALSGALPGAASSAAFTVDEVGWVIASADLATPRAIIARPAVEGTVSEVLKKHGAAVLVGGSGLGKSLVARAVAQQRNPSFLLVDLRDLDAVETRRRLDFIFARVGAISAPVMIFEDLNHFEDSSVTLSSARVLSALRRRDRVALITSYRKPSERALLETGLDADAVIEVPYFSEAEAKEAVSASGGAPETWGRLAYVIGGQGHPQLVHAFVMGMAARDWPVSELRDVEVRGLSSDEIDAAREAARRSLAAALPEGARTLLYRLSLVIGRFDRALALSIGALSSAIPRVGESMDELVGPWIESVGRNVYRVSPLAGQSGLGSLTNDEQRAIHSLIATQLLARRKIDASDANTILAHALAGKSEQSLAAMAHSVLTSEQETLALLAEHFFLLRLLRTDTPIYPDNHTISRMLRLAQFRLVAAGGKGSEISECVTALLKESDEEADKRFRQMFESVALSAVLITLGIADHVTGWIALLRRFRALVEGDRSLRSFKDNVEKAPGNEGMSFYGMLFSVGATGISSVERLEEIVGDLVPLDAGERAMWLEGYSGRLSDFGIFVNGPWSAEHKRNAVNPADAAERYKRMAERTKDWGLRPLTLQFHVARAIMLDEYGHDKAAALAALDEAVATLGNDIVLERARAKIYWRDDDHPAALNILKHIAEQVGRDNPIERAFAMREAAISAAKTGDWQQAETWFLEGRQAASLCEGEDMQAMAIGLHADAAVAALNVGAVDRALTGLAEVLIALRDLDAEATLRSAYCHRVARHTILWAQSKIEGRDTKIDGKSMVMLPGTCSNPEPLAAIRDHPLGPIDLAWYMLAEAEISSGVDVGIYKSLRARLSCGPIPELEVDIRNRLLVKDVQNLDSQLFAKHLSGFVEAHAYVRTSGDAIKKSWDVLDPPRGEIPRTPRNAELDAWVGTIAVDAILAFCSLATLGGTPEKIDMLGEALVAELGSSHLGGKVFTYWLGNKNALTDLDRVVADCIAVLRKGDHIDPRDLWGIALRLFEKAGHSNFKKVLMPRIAEWLRAGWQRIVSQESFRLSQPMQTVPTIEAVLAENCSNDERFVAKLLLATSSAVTVNLATSYRDQLRALAEGATLSEQSDGTSPGLR